ncbi:MAG: DMT family transporter [Phaeovulum sp.]|uniref:DMT family transporter n=1 Tax=Phaeovulum sp. TaxID=2934796 RepID=UPI0027304FC8|nr:DMT family transporter [Phaeovulum sp.]MDP2062857.1 DMT family transporter [Phaeovulum sp.]
MTEGPAPEPIRNNLRGAAWLLADMSLNIWALAIVKSLGLGLPAVQIVFLRAATGLVLLLPLLLRRPDTLRLSQPGLHGLRVALSSAALTTSFYAVAHLPLALFTAINFTRPLVLMGMAALLLRETIRPQQWVAGAVGLIGVMIAVQPGAAAFGAGHLALVGTVLAGTGAVIVTRRMREEAPLMMMVSYTLGLALVTALPAAWAWTPVGEAWPLVLMIGVFAQFAQFCFLRAQFWGDTGVLAPLGYASLPLSAGVGYFLFDEAPTLGFGLGAALIIAASIYASRR